MNTEFILIFIQLIVVAITTLLAIILWSKTRETAWIFVIIAITLIFGRTVFTALEFFGIIYFQAPSVFLEILVYSFIENIDKVFLSIALIIIIAKKA